MKSVSQTPKTSNDDHSIEEKNYSTLQSFPSSQAEGQKDPRVREGFRKIRKKVWNFPYFLAVPNQKVQLQQHETFYSNGRGGQAMVGLGICGDTQGQGQRKPQGDPDTQGQGQGGAPDTQGQVRDGQCHCWDSEMRGNLLGY